MTKASVGLQDLRRRIYVKAKADGSWRFWGLYVHVCKMETLREAYKLAKRKGGAPGVDGVTFEAIIGGKTRVIDVDLRAYFDNVRHHILLEKVARRVDDPEVMALLKMMLKATGKRGVAQGGVISPLLSNIYLNGVDRMLERAKQVTPQGKRTSLEYVRYADDMVILVEASARCDWLLEAVNKRLREELAKVQVEVNEEKSRVVELAKGEGFGFLGFDLRRVRSRKGVWRPHYTPQLKKRTALLRKLKDIFRRFQSQPVARVIQSINPILRGWIEYFAIGHSSHCFSYIRDWVEKKIRRHLMRARTRRGFGWKRWSSRWIYQVLGLYKDYRVRYYRPLLKALPVR
jgi:RNA-directed DNA polymerase